MTISTRSGKVFIEPYWIGKNHVDDVNIDYEMVDKDINVDAILTECEKQEIVIDKKVDTNENVVIMKHCKEVLYPLTQIPRPPPIPAVTTQFVRS